MKIRIAKFMCGRGVCRTRLVPAQRRSHVRWGFTVALCMALLVFFVAASGWETTFVDSGPILQDVTSDGFKVVWWDAAATTSVLAIRNRQGEVTVIPARREGTRFEAQAAGLQRSAAYDYWVGAAASYAPDGPSSGQVRTAKRDDEPFSFIVFGDSGRGHKEQYELAELMCRYTSDLILHVGDLVYIGTSDAAYQSAFFDPYRSLLSDAPFYPVLGNHDVIDDGGAKFLSTFSLPANGPLGLAGGRCYSFSYGNAFFVAIDVTLPHSILRHTVAPWLAETLANSAATWRFVFFHYPPYSERHQELAGDGVRRSLVPVMEAGHVDVVFSGHAHRYERTLPLRGGEVSPDDGIIYITAGTGGGSLDGDEPVPPAYMAAFNGTEFGFVSVSVSGNRLHLRQNSIDNRTIDQLSLDKKR